MGSQVQLDNDDLKFFIGICMVILILIYLCYHRSKKITISLNKPSHVQARKSQPESVRNLKVSKAKKSLKI